MKNNFLNFNTERLLITGAEGMVGKALIKILPKNNNIISIDLPKYDLRKQDEVDNIFSTLKPDYVIHLAARVGGVKENSNKLAEFYTDNILMNTFVLHAAHKYKVKKLISMLSTCVYPDKCSYPLTENQIHDGFPHDSNYGYAFSKRMLHIQSKAYRDQYNDNFVCVMPNNLIGEEDNFDLNSSHVVPAIIRKIYESKLNKTEVILWGNGECLREFTYVGDLAKILLIILNSYNRSEPLNIGNPKEYSIKYVANCIKNNLKFKGNIIFNINEPSGQFRKPSSNERFLNFVKTNNIKFDYTNFEEALKNICNWFVKTYPNVRGI